MLSSISVSSQKWEILKMFMKSFASVLYGSFPSGPSDINTGVSLLSKLLMISKVTPEEINLGTDASCVI